jgi:hypothetical protein
MNGDEFIEVGQSGLIAQADGWWLDKNTGNRISPEGLILNVAGEQIGTVHFDEEDE